MRCHILSIAKILALLAAPALADTAKPPNVLSGALSKPGPVARVVLAQQLFLTGLADKDPVALISAARLMARVGVVHDDARKPEFVGKRPKIALPVNPAPLPDSAATLATAASLAAGDETLLSLIDTEKSAVNVPKGAVRQSAAAIPNASTDAWTLAFFGAVTAELAVLGDGKGNLSISVTDEAGNPICATTMATDRLYCRFTPAANGNFTVSVTNPGGSGESYLLITN